MQKTIFITGASSGLGKAAAKLFQQKGWKVIATMREPHLEKELSELDNVSLLPLDVTRTEQIKEAYSAAVASGNVDVVFNNAGYGLLGAMEAFNDEEIVSQINTNLLGVIRVTQAFIPHFRENKGGCFISTTSLGGQIGFPLTAVYNATKFAIEGWSEGLSYELAPHNIKIKTIAPGAIDTDFSGRSLEKRSHPAYKETEDLLFASMGAMVAAASSAEQIAEIVFEAATDDKNQLCYLAGHDANALYNKREEIGREAMRVELGKQMLGL